MSPRVRWALAAGLLCSVGFAVWQAGVFLARHGATGPPRAGPWQTAVATPTTMPRPTSPVEMIKRATSDFQPMRDLPPVPPPGETDVVLAVRRPAWEPDMLERQWVYRAAAPEEQLAGHYREGLQCVGWRYVGTRRGEQGGQCLVFTRPDAVATVRIGAEAGQPGKNRIVLHVTQPSSPATIAPSNRTGLSPTDRQESRDQLQRN